MFSKTIIALLSFSLAFVHAFLPTSSYQSSLRSSHIKSSSSLEERITTTSGASISVRPSSCSRRRALHAMLGPEVYLAADLTKVVSDDIYGPMFFQAMLLSVSGVIAAAALAAVIAFKGDSLTTELLNEAYQERDDLREKLNAQEGKDGTIIVGFDKILPPPTDEEEKAAAAAAAAAAKERELVGASKMASSSSSIGSDVNDFED